MANLHWCLFLVLISGWAVADSALGSDSPLALSCENMSDHECERFKKSASVLVNYVASRRENVNVSLSKDGSYYFAARTPLVKSGKVCSYQGWEFRHTNLDAFADMAEKEIDLLYAVFLRYSPLEVDCREPEYGSYVPTVGVDSGDFEVIAENIVTGFFNRDTTKVSHTLLDDESFIDCALALKNIRLEWLRRIGGAGNDGNANVRPEFYVYFQSDSIGCKLSFFLTNNNITEIGINPFYTRW